MSLPVHFRYQSPCDSKYVRVTIPPPLLLYQHSSHILSTTALPCNATTSALCDWARLDYTMEEPLVALIPCGNEQHLVLVIVTTLTVTLAAAVTVCLAISYVQYHSM